MAALVVTTAAVVGTTAYIAGRLTSNSPPARREYRSSEDDKKLGWLIVAGVAIVILASAEYTKQKASELCYRRASREHERRASWWPYR